MPMLGQYSQVQTKPKPITLNEHTTTLCNDIGKLYSGNLLYLSSKILSEPVMSAKVYILVEGQPYCTHVGT